MKHTPGPVYVSEEPSSYPVCFLEDEPCWDSRWVNVDEPIRVDAQDDAEFIAWCYNNAPVVEAAPELLDLLEMAEVWISEVLNEATYVVDEDYDQLELIRTAIAKARGES